MSKRSAMLEVLTREFIEYFTRYGYVEMRNYEDAIGLVLPKSEYAYYEDHIVLEDIRKE